MNRANPRPRGRTSRGAIAALLLAVAATPPARPATCAVPGGYPDIGAAVSDPLCTEIVLADQTFIEDVIVQRDLSLRGTPGGATTIQGQVLVGGAGTVAAIEDLRVDTTTPTLSGCFRQAVGITGGARATTVRVDVRSSADGLCAQDLIFADSFESGDLSQWLPTP